MLEKSSEDQLKSYVHLLKNQGTGFKGLPSIPRKATFQQFRRIIICTKWLKKIKVALEDILSLVANNIAS